MSVVEFIKAYALKSLSPATFLVGLILGFGFCRHYGVICSQRNPFPDFKRFSQAIGPSSSFYVSATQMMEICKSRASKDDVLVIIGGSSTFLGVGQPVDDMWSLHLEKNLGPGFVVVNLAHRGNSATGGAESVAEAMFKQGYKVIYLANTLAPQCGQPDGSEPYAFIFWNAYYRDLLFAWPARDEYFAEDMGALKRRRELQMRARFDRLAYSEDLWNSISYNQFSTVWDPIAFDHFWAARKEFEDIEGPPLPVPERFAGDIDRVLKGMKDGVNIVNPDGTIADVNLWTDLDRQINAGFPPEMRPRCLIAVITLCPYYVHKMTEMEQFRYHREMDFTVDKYHAAGINAVEIGRNYDDVDFKDLVHMVPSGGKRLAADLAPEVQKLAHQLYGK